MFNNKIDKEDSKRLLELDVLRGIAALYVVVFHFTRGLSFGDTFGKYGVTGVDLFFIISGFVIYISINHSKSWKDFVVSRVTRLYPVYWVAVTFTAILILLNFNFFGIVYPNFWQTYLVNLTMFHEYFGFDDIDASYWTLLIEMFFYVYVLVISVTFTIKRLEIISYLLLAGCVFYNFFLLDFSYTFYQLVRKGFPLINHFPFFFAGILFYKIKFEKATITRFIGVILCFIVAVFLFDNGGRSKDVLNISEYIITTIVYLIIWIAYVFNYLGFIVNKVMLFFGSISYSLYLIHQYFGSKFLIPILTGKFSLNPTIAVLVALLSTIGVAYLLTKYVEKPSLYYLRSKWKAKRKAAFIS